MSAPVHLCSTAQSMIGVPASDAITSMPRVYTTDIYQIAIKKAEVCIPETELRAFSLEPYTSPTLSQTRWFFLVSLPLQIPPQPADRALA